MNEEKIINEIMEKAAEMSTLYYKEIANEYKDCDYPKEFIFQALLILMIDGLLFLDVPKEIIMDHIESHLKGNTYFYTGKNTTKMH